MTERWSLFYRGFEGEGEEIINKRNTEIRDRINETADRMAGEVFESLRRFVRIPSVVGEEGEAQEWMSELYHSLGLDVIQFVPQKKDLMFHPAYGESGFPYHDSRPNVIGILPGTGEGRSLILNGHVDVVSPESVEAWDNQDPWSGSIQGNFLYGRGAADMKSGLLANYYALKTVLDLGIRPRGKIILESVIEEEAGGSGGTLAVFLAGHCADAMIISEPSDLQMVTAHPGIIVFRVRVQGKSIHGAQSQHGVNAIGKLTKIYDRLISLDRERAERNRDPFFEKSTGRSCNLNIGTFRAGDWPSTVAGWAQLEGRVSYLPGEETEGVKQEVVEALGEVVNKDEWLSEHPPQVEWLRDKTKPWVQDPEVQVIKKFRETASNILTFPPGFATSPAGLDTRFGPFFGVPSFVFGPRGGNLHGPNEYVELDSVIDTIKVFAAFIVGWCGVE